MVTTTIIEGSVYGDYFRHYELEHVRNFERRAAEELDSLYVVGQLCKILGILFNSGPFNLENAFQL